MIGLSNFQMFITKIFTPYNITQKHTTLRGYMVLYVSGLNTSLLFTLTGLAVPLLLCDENYLICMLTSELTVHMLHVIVKRY